MQAVFEKIQRIAQADLDVLIVGETGTGKELVARSIHKRSQRKNGRFVPVDCGAIPGDLLESEFFGHERGAFTGAHVRRMGLLEFANQGTFFLDEIGELPLLLQSKLLRVLQERKIRRIGAQEEVEVDVRVIAATGRDLAVELRERRFREDLYYRIHVAVINLPPLRQRQEDIPLLVTHFTERYCRELDRQTVGIDPKVMEVFQKYPWPGNIRELQNAIKRSLTFLRNNALTMDDLPEEILIQASSLNGDGGRGGFFRLRDQRIETFEREYLSSLLSACGGDIGKAVHDSEIPRATFYRMLKRHQLNLDDFRPPPANKK